MEIPVDSILQSLAKLLKNHIWPLFIPSAFTAFLGYYFGYYFGRKSKIDDIRLPKVDAVAEELAVLLQEDWDNRESMFQIYRANFSHMNSRVEAARIFKERENLYAPMRDVLSRLSELHPKILDANRRAKNYLKPQVTKLVSSYVETTMFSYSSSAFGRENYEEKLFEHLDDKVNNNRRSKLFERIMKLLRKAR